MEFQRTPPAYTDCDANAERSVTTNALSSALQAAALGLRVHPLHGKRALVADWPTRANSDAAQIRRWLSPGRNYGVVCDQVAVIDTDTPELADWWRRHMPETPWVVQTPRGGRHYYYRSVPGLRNAVKAHHGWDVRAGGNGYVVGSGSVVDGKVYKLLGEATLDLPPFDPAWLPRIPVEPCPVRKSSGGARGKIVNIRAYLRTILSIQGSRGSDACYRVACILREEGYAPEEALAEMIEWNQHCATPHWSVREMEKKIRDAFAKTAGGNP